MMLPKLDVFLVLRIYEMASTREAWKEVVMSYSKEGMWETRKYHLHLGFRRLLEVKDSSGSVRTELLNWKQTWCLHRGPNTAYKDSLER
jgi:hypothetical protein